MDLLPVGYFSKTHGVKGQLVLKPDRDFEPDTVKAIFIEMSGAKAPYFVTELKQTNSGIIIGLEEVTTVEKARSFVGKQVLIDARLVLEDEDEENWTGYELIDKYFGSLGSITGTSDNGQQVILALNYKGKEVLLPLVDDFIERIDEAGQKIFFNAPQGLIDLYISENTQSSEEE